MLIVRLDEITDHGITREYCLDPHDLPEAEVWEETGDLKLDAPVKVEIRIFRANHFIEVHGTLKTAITSFCGRCLSELKLDLNESFALTFTNERLVVHDEGSGDDEGVELSEDELGLIYFDEDFIDLSEAVADQLYLALPIRPLCADDCKGLCSQCGVDLNKKECGCRPPDFNNKFSALKDIKIN